MDDSKEKEMKKMIGSIIGSIIGRKVGMTQIFAGDGTVVPVTVVEAGPVVVTRMRSKDKDGYNAVQIGYGVVDSGWVSKPVAGQFAKVGLKPMRYLREFRVEDVGGIIKVGQELDVEIFDEGEKVSVTGISKGKGFAGWVKRWHFHGGPKTHGSMIHRKPQSAGATDAARTFKGVKRPGRMGGKRVTTRGLRVVKIDSKRNLLLIKGAIPGANGGIVVISKMSKMKVLPPAEGE